MTSRSQRLRWLGACLFGWVLVASPAMGMMFITHPLGDGEFLIEGLGTLINGDGGRLRNSVNSVEARSGKIVAVAISSPGGLLQEAGRMADLIHIKKLRVVVFSGARCLSACFLVFAAGSARAVGVDAVIGVHRASEIGSVDTTSSRVATDNIARALVRYGVPQEIINKMRETDPKTMEALTSADLQLMGVVILPDGKPLTAAH